VRAAIRELGFVGYGWDDMSLTELNEVRGLLGVVLGDGCGADLKRSSPK
jgi:hypothetical protein